MSPAPPPPSTPPNCRLYAVGDIHGRADLLAQLMTLVQADAATAPGVEKEIIFLGDYVDRGVNSRGVIEYLMHKLPPGMKAVFLRGNHEDVMMRFVAGDAGQAEGWLQYGGAATLVSYGINPFGKGIANNYPAMQAAFAEKMPDAHRQFLNATKLDYQRGDYYFVHAGVRPNVPLAQQTEGDRLWIRHEFLQSRANYGKFVVHGHTVAPEPDIQQNRIGIDTGAYATGHLTCLVLDGVKRYFLKT